MGKGVEKLNATEEVKQKKVSIPTDEMKLAKKQAKKDGFGDNVAAWIRWLIRKKHKEIPEKTSYTNSSNKQNIETKKETFTLMTIHKARLFKTVKTSYPKQLSFTRRLNPCFFALHNLN